MARTGARKKGSKARKTARKTTAKKQATVDEPSSEHSTVERQAPQEVPPPTDEVTHEDVRASLRRQGVRASGNTATGLAVAPARVAQGTEVEPEGVDGEDNLLNPKKENSKAQTDTAVYTSNGSIPYGFVPSPSGLMPAAVLGDKAVQQAGVDAAVRGALRGPRQRRRITEDLLSTMSKAEIRAVATDRGYDVPDASGRGPLGTAFLKAQEEDDAVETEEDAEGRLVETPTAPVPGVSGAAAVTAPPAPTK